MIQISKSISLLILFCLAFTLLSGQAIITDRPDQTESSSTVGNGNLQIETGILIGFEGESENSTRQLLAPTSLFRYGITKNIEIRFLSQFESIKNGNRDVQGISDIEIGTKVQLLKDDSKNTEIAFLSHLIMPTGSKELTNGGFGSINKLSISHEVNQRVGLGYNLGYNYFGNGKGDLTYSLALGIGVNSKVGIYIEPYGDFVDFEKHLSNFDAGFTYLANDNLQYDFSFGTGINNRMNYISLGFSWLMNRTEVN